MAHKNKHWILEHLGLSKEDVLSAPRVEVEEFVKSNNPKGVGRKGVLIVGYTDHRYVTFDGLTEASKHGYNAFCIWQAIHKRFRHKGFYWQYA